MMTFGDVDATTTTTMYVGACFSATKRAVLVFQLSKRTYVLHTYVGMVDVDGWLRTLTIVRRRLWCCCGWQYVCCSHLSHRCVVFRALGFASMCLGSSTMLVMAGFNDQIDFVYTFWFSFVASNMVGYMSCASRKIHLP